MNDAYSPATGEHITTDDPAPWMGRAGTPAPDYDPATAGCFWRGDHWEVVAAPPPSVPNPLIDTAKDALSRSDTTILRCVEAGVSVPVEWSKWRKELRAIVSGADTTSTKLPDQPAYPAGT